MFSSYNLTPGTPPAVFESHLNILTNTKGKIPLWRTDHESHREFYEVEILTDRNDVSDVPLAKDMGQILNLNKYKCHICNIDVPETYKKEHSNSSKHKACNEIANIALERTKLQMQLEIAVPRKIDILDSYFCEPCASVILTTEKEAHEATKAHKVSKKHDELLNELLKIYMDIDNVEVESEIDELELLKEQIELEAVEDTEAENKDSVSETDGLEVPKEQIELEAVEDSVARNRDPVDAEHVVLDIKSMQEEYITVLKTEIQSILDTELESMVANEFTKVKDIVDKMNETALMQDKSNALEDTVNEHESNTQATVKSGRNPKNRVYKKYVVRKKKEQLPNRNQAVVLNNEENGAESNDPVKDVAKSTVIEYQAKTPETNSPLEEEVHSSDVAKETKRSDNKDGSLNKISKKIDAIMAKYFDSTRTVDALNNNTDREHNKNKISREGKKSKDNIAEKNKEEDQKSKVTKAKDKEQTKEDKQPHEERKENQDLEDNNNTNTEQNKNYRAQNADNTHKNKETNDQKNKKIVEQQKTKDTPNKISKREKSGTPSFNLVLYFKDIARKCQTQPIHTLEAVTDTVVEIIAINGDKIRVLMNNFHSFHMKANDIYCKVCESPNVRRPEWHIAESEHRAKIMLPITDRNGVRQLDDIWSHCILCNDMTKNVDFHLQSLLHRNKLKHCLVELGPTDSDNEDNTNNEPAPEVRKKLTGKRNRATITSLVLKNNLAMTSKNYLNCVICNVIVNYDLHSVQQHITSFDHLNNFELEKNENKFVDIDENRSYCISCDITISKYDIVPHCKGKRHQKLLKDLLKKQGGADALDTDETEVILSSISQNVKKQSKGKIEDSEMICFVCNVILYCVDEHMDSFVHKKSYYSYLESNKLNEIEADIFYCIPCNTVITIDYLMSHCTGRKHRVTLKNYVGNRSEADQVMNDDNVPQLPSTSQVYMVPSSVDKTMPLKVLYQFREMSGTKLLCIVCDEEVPYTRKHAQYHVSTLDHVVAFNLMMLWNKIKKRDDRYFCDICRLDMTYFSEITHVFGKQHAAYLAKEPKGTVYEYDRTLVTHGYAMSHKVGDRIRPSSVISMAKNK